MAKKFLFKLKDGSIGEYDYDKYGWFLDKQEGIVRVYEESTGANCFVVNFDEFKSIEVVEDGET